MNWLHKELLKNCPWETDSDVVFWIAFVAGPLHCEIPIQMLHFSLFLDEILSDTMECHDQCMPILPIDFLLKCDLIPLEIPILTLMAIVNGNWWQLQHFLKFLFSDVDTFFPILDVLVSEIDLAPWVFWFANRDLDHRWEGRPNDHRV